MVSDLESWLQKLMPCWLMIFPPPTTQTLSSLGIYVQDSRLDNNCCITLHYLSLNGVQSRDLASNQITLWLVIFSLLTTQTLSSLRMYVQDSRPDNNCCITLHYLSLKGVQSRDLASNLMTHWVVIFSPLTAQTLKFSRYLCTGF